MEIQKPPKTLVLLTVFILAVIAIGTVTLSGQKLPPPININVQGQPTIGNPNAKVRVVVFEEPKCSHCVTFNNQVYPEIKKELIDTNKILYTVFPVSFLPGSMPAANALLCVFRQNSSLPNGELFFKYLDHIYLNQPKENRDWGTTEQLIEMAKQTSSEIDLNHLKTCIEQEKFKVQIDKNNQYGNKIMGHLTTPTVYVNGIRLDSVSFADISSHVNHILESHP